VSAGTYGEGGEEDQDGASELSGTEDYALLSALLSALRLRFTDWRIVGRGENLVGPGTSGGSGQGVCT